MTGYADIETILDRYTHAQEERIRAAGELLTGNLNRVIPDVNPDTMKSPQSLENIGFAGKFFLRFLKFSRQNALKSEKGLKALLTP